ncbi:MAG: ABC transporter permease [Pyrinomonadaceae bacterium]
MTNIWQDIRYGWRMLWKSPGFTLVALLTVALGIGANTALFSVVNAVLLRPLPVAQPGALVNLWGTNLQGGEPRESASFLNFADWRDQSHVFASVAAYSNTFATLTGGDAPEAIDGLTVSPELFQTLALQPVVGRAFTAQDIQADNSPIVISQELWQRRFGARSDIIGQAITLDGRPRTVVGVLPAGFRFPFDASNGKDFWTPLDPKDELNVKRGVGYLNVIARLKPGVTLQQAQAELDTIAHRLAEQYPEHDAGRGVQIVTTYEEVVGGVRTALLVLLGAVGFVLLIACANVANLLLARATRRQREIAVRTALGATRWRIVRQLLTESLLLSLAGGVGGLLLALWGVDVLRSALPEDVPRVREIALDGRVLAFTLGVAVVTGLIFGLAPALAAARLDVNEALKESGRDAGGWRRNRVRSFLVVAEVALSLVLLVGAGLLLKSFVRLREINPGFKPEPVLTYSVALPTAQYQTPAEQTRFFQQLLTQTASAPGVNATAAVFPLPFSGDNARGNFEIEGRPVASESESPNALSYIISPDYLRALGIPLREGRGFSERDTASAPHVVLINETLARRYFAGTDPVGRHLVVSSIADLDKPKTCEIIGVVGDVKHSGLDAEAEAEYYLPYQQSTLPFMTLVVRGTNDKPSALATDARAAVAQLDKDLPLTDIKPMSDWLAASVAPRRFNMLLLGGFALLALCLATVGIYGVMAYAVAQRTHEIGIRIALGAQARDVLRLVVGQGMLLTLIGLGVGLAGAFALTRVLATLLFNVKPTDPLVFAGVTLLLALVALVACYIPARRATRVDPMIALRQE